MQVDVTYAASATCHYAWLSFSHAMTYLFESVKSAARRRAAKALTACEDHIGGFFSDHDAGRIGVAAGNDRHHRGVDHPQPR